MNLLHFFSHFHILFSLLDGNVFGADSCSHLSHLCFSISINKAPFSTKISAIQVQIIGENTINYKSFHIFCYFESQFWITFYINIAQFLCNFYQNIIHYQLWVEQYKWNPPKQYYYYKYNFNPGCPHSIINKSQTEKQVQKQPPRSSSSAFALQSREFDLHPKSA